MEDRFRFRIWKPAFSEMDYDAFMISDGSVVDNYGLEIGGEPILMQCTGLKDRNGKLIYEGDVMNYRTPFAIEWYQKCGGYSPWSEDQRYVDPETLEIIGNIYENPDLLEKK